MESCIPCKHVEQDQYTESQKVGFFKNILSWLNAYNIEGAESMSRTK